MSVKQEQVQLGNRLEVFVATPTAGAVQANYAISIAPMMLHYLNHQCRGTLARDRKIHHQMILGSVIGDSRDKLVDLALEHPITHLLFIDDDMGFAEDALNVALNRQLPIVLGNYRVKCEPFNFTARANWDDEPLKIIDTTEDSSGVEPGSWGGFGFALIERRVLEAVKKPRFLGQYNHDAYTTEDYPFFLAAKQAGFGAVIDHDLSKGLSHRGGFTFTHRSLS